MRPEYRNDDAWVLFDEIVEGLTRRSDVARVCDVGGGANPQLSLGYVETQSLDYTVLDVSAEELSKSPPGYVTRVGSVLDPPEGARGPYDLVLSKSVLEHIDDPDGVHASVYRMLSPGGWAVHLFPTLYSLPFVVNRVLPERLTEKMLRAVSPDRVPEGNQRKFRAYYRWCRGPTRAQIARFTSRGWNVERYVGYYWHSYYDRLPVLGTWHRRMAEQLVRHPIPSLTCFAVLVLRKPGTGPLGRRS